VEQPAKPRNSAKPPNSAKTPTLFNAPTPVGSFLLGS
jgi:hypothetical protein